MVPRGMTYALAFTAVFCLTNSVYGGECPPDPSDWICDNYVGRMCNLYQAKVDMGDGTVCRGCHFCILKLDEQRCPLVDCPELYPPPTCTQRRSQYFEMEGRNCSACDTYQCY